MSALAKQSAQELLTLFNQHFTEHRFPEAVQVGEHLELAIEEEGGLQNCDVEYKFYFMYITSLVAVVATSNEKTNGGMMNALKQAAPRIAMKTKRLSSLVNVVVKYVGNEVQEALKVLNGMMGTATISATDVLSKLPTPTTEQIEMHCLRIIAGCIRLQQYGAIGRSHHVIPVQAVADMVVLSNEQCAKECVECFNWTVRSAAPTASSSSAAVVPMVYPARCAAERGGVIALGTAGRTTLSETASAVPAVDMLRELTAYVAYFEKRSTEIDVIISKDAAVEKGAEGGAPGKGSDTGASIGSFLQSNLLGMISGASRA